MKKFLYFLPLLFCCACTSMQRNASVTAPADAQENAMQEVVMYAMSMAETPYRYGGNTPEDGFDCSGFVRYVFQKSASLLLPRTSQEMGREGTPIKRNELRPGDLVFFNTLRRPYSHVGIYVGDNRFVHAPKAGKTVSVTDMNGDYWLGRYNGARRISVNQENRAADTALLRSKTAALEQ